MVTDIAKILVFLAVVINKAPKLSTKTLIYRVIPCMNR